ncbi:MAG: hypothetical protein V2I43_11230 [Parvularcula sp.]|nr:hypothetical protein [Parvularcula sp.]
MRSAKLETVLDQLSPFLPQPDTDGRLGDAEVLSLLYPTPDFAGHREKFDIAKKNLLSALSDEAFGPAKLRDRVRPLVESLDASDMPGGGIAVFATKDQVQYLPLSERPMPFLHIGKAALALPVLIDAQDSRRFWLAVLDVERPVLYHVADGRISDKTPDGVQTLTETMEQYEPMGDVLWHSSGAVRRSGAPAKFHALGTATEDLRQDESNRVMAAFARKVEDAVTGSDPLFLIGGPSRLGHFREQFSHRNWAGHDIQAAGDAQDEDELFKRAFAAFDEYKVGARKEETEDLDLSNTLTDLDELLNAAVEGRLERVLVRRDDSGILGGTDERLKLQEADETLVHRSLIVAYAVKHGAQIHVLDELDAPSGLTATTRYDH